MHVEYELLDAVAANFITVVSKKYGFKEQSLDELLLECQDKMSEEDRELGHSILKLFGL